MATAVDIVPSIGHAIVATQLGVGATPGYDAIDLRRLSQIGVQEGVVDGPSWVVSQHSPLGLSVDIAATGTPATVQGDSISDQGLYAVAPHASVINLTVAAAHASLPRLDQVILHVYDSAIDGSGSNKASVEMLTGTATSGTTLDNGHDGSHGAAALPPTAIRLADVLVPPAATTITNTNIRDRRRWCNGAGWQGTRGTDIQRFNNTFVAVDTATLQARLECSGVPVLVNFSANGDGSANSNSDLMVSYWTDGALTDSQKFAQVTGGSANRPCNFTMMTLPAAGSHLFTAVMQSTNGDGVTIRGIMHFNIRELVSPNATNGIV